MHSKFMIIRSVLFLISSIVSLSVWSLHVIVDPGHGGSDRGAQRGKVAESHVVLEVANKLKTLLDKNEGFQVTMTRETDRGISLDDRIKLIEDVQADLFVSIHANSVNDTRVKGVEFFFQQSLPYQEGLNQLRRETDNQMEELRNSKEVSKKKDLALILGDLHRQYRIFRSLELNKLLARNWETDAVSIKQAPFRVLVKSKIPSVLLEIGFVTNAAEAKKLLSDDYQQEIAEKIYTSLVQYKDKVEKSENKSLN